MNTRNYAGHLLWQFLTVNRAPNDPNAGPPNTEVGVYNTVIHTLALLKRVSVAVLTHSTVISGIVRAGTRKRHSMTP